MSGEGKEDAWWGGSARSRAARGLFAAALGEAVEAKRRLARAAAALLGADEIVFIDSSTTAYFAARRMLAGASGFACLTNLVPVMDLFSAADPSRASMVGLGGIFRPLTLSFVGPCAIHTVESYVADRAFFSVKGITPDGHLTEPNPLEAEVKRAMIRRRLGSPLFEEHRQRPQRRRRRQRRLPQVVSSSA